MKQFIVPLIISYSLFGMDFSHIEDAKKQLVNAIHALAQNPTELKLSSRDMENLGNAYKIAFNRIDSGNTAQVTALQQNMTTLPKLLEDAYQNMYLQYASIKSKIVTATHKPSHQPQRRASALEKIVLKLRKEAENRALLVRMYSDGNMIQKTVARLLRVMCYHIHPNDDSWESSLMQPLDHYIISVQEREQ